jgi:CheY-like chemotaxis protein
MMRRVLVVEDEPENRLLLGVVLTAEGYDVEEVEDGPAALAAASARHPDLILLDVMLPGMNGYAVLERLRADPSTAGVPVIMLTALAQRGHVERAVEIGADGYITKPFEPADLLQAMEAALQKSR